MTETVNTIIHPKFCTVTTQSVAEVLPGARLVFSALAPCPLYGETDERPGMEVQLTRRATVFSRWHIQLPQKRVFVPRALLEG
jgi:hypothetical protein